MAIGTPASAGTSVSLGGVSSGNFTATAPSASRLFIAAGGATSASRTISSVAGGSLTWAVGKAVTQTKGLVEVWSADCPGGVTSATITVTLSGALLAGAIAGFYCTGLATSSPLDGTGASTARAVPASQNWSSGAAATTNADDLILACSYGDFFTAPTNTPTGTVNTELVDFASANDIGLVVQYVIVAATQASITGTGSWGGTPDSDATVLAAYKANTGGGGAVAVKQLAALGVG